MRRWTWLIILTHRDCAADYPYDLDVSDIAKRWVLHREENVATLRDNIYTSRYSGQELDTIYTEFLG